jgi:hypothetical protein
MAAYLDIYFGGTWTTYESQCACPACTSFRTAYPNGAHEDPAYLAAAAEATAVRAAALVEQERLNAVRAEQRRIEREEEERRREERQAQLVVAAERSTALFVSLLTEEQKVEWDRTRSVTFSSTSGLQYRLNEGYSGNVYGYDKARHYCCYMNPDRGEKFPVADHMIAQLLHLKYNEEYFLKTAC